MLTFFRRIRKGLLEGGAASKYMLYAIGEIALVVIGILIALQINNWNETKKDNQYKNKLITEFISIIEADLEQLDTIIKIQQIAMHSSQRLLSDIRNEGIPINYDSTGLYLSNTQLCMFTFYPQEGIFNLVSGTDAIRLIKIDRLIKLMFELYDHDLERLKTNNTIMDDTCQPYARIIASVGIISVPLESSSFLRKVVSNSIKKDYSLYPDISDNIKWINNLSRAYIKRLKVIRNKYLELKKLCIMEAELH